MSVFIDTFGGWVFGLRLRSCATSDPRAATDQDLAKGAILVRSSAWRKFRFEYVRGKTEKIVIRAQ